MAVPKRKKSKSKSKSRRANYSKIKLPSMTRCKNCNTMRISHSVCDHCGFYKNRIVIQKN